MFHMKFHLCATNNKLPGHTNGSSFIHECKIKHCTAALKCMYTTTLQGITALTTANHTVTCQANKYEATSFGHIVDIVADR